MLIEWHALDVFLGYSLWIHVSCFVLLRVARNLRCVLVLVSRSWLWGVCCWWSVGQHFEVCVGQSVKTLRFALVSQSGIWGLCWSVSQSGLWGVCWCWSVSQDFEVCVGQSVRTLRCVLVSQSGLCGVCWSVSQDFEVCVDVGQSVLRLAARACQQHLEFSCGHWPLVWQLGVIDHRSESN